MRTTLGGYTTLGGGFTLGGGPTLVGGVRLGVESTLEGWADIGRGMIGGGTKGGISEPVSGFQAPKKYRSLEITSCWLWCAVAGASLMAHERKLRAWTMHSLGVSVGWLT